MPKKTLQKTAKNQKKIDFLAMTSQELFEVVKQYVPELTLEKINAVLRQNNISDGNSPFDFGVFLQSLCQKRAKNKKE